MSTTRVVIAVDEIRVREIVAEMIDDQLAYDFDPDPAMQARYRAKLRLERSNRVPFSKAAGCGHE